MNTYCPVTKINKFLDSIQGMDFEVLQSDHLVNRIDQVISYAYMIWRGDRYIGEVRFNMDMNYRLLEIQLTDHDNNKRAFDAYSDDLYFFFSDILFAENSEKEETQKSKYSVVRKLGFLAVTGLAFAMNPGLGLVVATFCGLFALGLAANRGEI